MPTERVYLSREHRRRLWGAVAVACLLAACLLWGQAAWFLHRHEAWRAACRQINASTALLAPQSEARLRGCSWEKYWYKPLTPEQICGILGGGTVSVAPNDYKGRRVLIWRHAASGYEAEFYLDDRGLNGMSHGRNPGAFHPKEPKPSTWYLVVEAARKQLAGSPWNWGLLIWVWAALLLATIFGGRYRGALAEVMLAAAAICAIGWFVPTEYIPGPQFVGGNDRKEYWFFAALLAGFSAFVWWCTRPRRTRELAARCPHCQYDLRGNVSGICPECGQVIPAEIRRIIPSAAETGS